MKRFVLSLLATGALLGVGIASQAQTLTYELLTDTPWTTTGVAGAGSDASIINVLLTPVPNPFTYTVPSVLKFGEDLTTPGMGNPSTSTVFAATPVDFNFTLTSAGGAVDLFHVAGMIDGEVGFGATGAAFSTAKITFTSITDSLGNVGVASIDPNNGLGALRISSVIGEASVVTYLDTPQSKPAPNLTLTTAGFITATAVPEPGTVALLASASVSGSVFLLRRRRRV